MIRRPPRSTRTDTRFPYTTLFRSDAMPLDQAVLTARDRETPAPHRLHLAVAHAGQVGAHDIGGGLEHPFLVCESLRVEALARSEEHTSELQSLMRISYAVFCFKKKKTQHLATTRQQLSYNK